MDRVFVCSQYGFKVDGTTPISDNVDLTLVANTLNDKNLIITNGDCNKSFAGTYDPKIGFGIAYRFKNKNEAIETIKNASYVKLPIIAAVAQASTHTFTAPVNTLAVGQTIAIECHVMSDDIWDKDRRISFPYILTTADNLTTYSNADYWLKRLISQFNAKHSDLVTLTASSAYVFTAAVTVAGVSVNFSSGGVLPQIATVFGTPATKSQGSSAEIQKLYDEYNSVRGDGVTHTKQDSDLYNLPSPVVEGTNYIQYVITFDKLTSTHPLGTKTTAVTRKIHICIPEMPAFVAPATDVIRDADLENVLNLVTA
jgi:hypothetical protein